jgi:hypothetical protein
MLQEVILKPTGAPLRPCPTPTPTDAPPEAPLAGDSGPESVRAQSCTTPPQAAVELGADPLRQEATAGGAATPPGQMAPDVNEAQQASQPEDESSLAAFIQGIAKPVAAAILKTPAKKSKAPRPSEAPTIRCSGRLAVKALKKGNRSAEEMAQEVLCKKIGCWTDAN